ncbi:hypothetical protein BIU88_08880 [Chlorobaculum limnaeum]|uniref:Ice-binding protein C-terminal domain-containing protein n=1 Tax=Chlorobaculum limnaeum TaxID=274537 RepID=A0A1D8D677_CHLLM|nr:PEP-CTERM sorting domain-containing protein [Chlorobaculum limnaeum]AOS84234.1 hypothetical protein BIU88_08880 [Chlorobaculum limnaeum]
MKAAAATIGILFTAMSWTGALADVISSNPITGTNPGADNPYVTGLSGNANITASGIGRGAGITGNTGADRYNAKNWSLPFDANDYFTFTLDAKDGYEINFTSFEYHAQRSTTGPTSFAFRSSIDGFATDIGTPTAAGTTIDLPGDKFYNLTDPIEFRLYGYGSEGGTFSVNDYTFNGTVEAVPEPGTLALVGVGSLLMLASRHRTRKSSEMAA